MHCENPIEIFALCHDRCKNMAINYENAQFMVYKSGPTQEGASHNLFLNAVFASAVVVQRSPIHIQAKT